MTQPRKRPEPGWIWRIPTMEFLELLVVGKLITPIDESNRCVDCGVALRGTKSRQRCVQCRDKHEYGIRSVCKQRHYGRNREAYRQAARKWRARKKQERLRESAA